MTFPPRPGRPGRRWTPVAALTAVLTAVAVALIHSLPTGSASLEEPRPEPLLTAPPGSVRVLEDDAYTRRLEQVLAGARVSIRVVMFSVVISDKSGPRNPVRRVLDRLIERHRAGVSVQVVLDHGVPPGRARPGEEMPSENAYQELAAAGVPVRWEEDQRTTHVKCVVVDGRWCFMGSHNWTASALGKNREWSLEIEDPTLAADLTARMDRVWAIGQR
jgi:phosphatidylserine/phosphatidylglycerophosphate/cardiolipin synthase-like enzyme